MHLFLAIDLPLTIKKNLFEQLKEIRVDYADINWTSMMHYYLTLHFFGETDRKEEIIKKIESVLYDKHSFYLYSLHADIFIKKRITIYLEFAREKRLDTLVFAIRSVFPAEYEKKFIPHITLGRYRIPSKQQYFLLKKKVKNLDLEIEFPVKKLTLFQAVIEGKKPIYKKIKQLSLIP